MVHKCLARNGPKLGASSASFRQLALRSGRIFRQPATRKRAQLAEQLGGEQLGSLDNVRELTELVCGPDLPPSASSSSASAQVGRKK